MVLPPTARGLVFAFAPLVLLSGVAGAQSGPDNDPAAAQGYVDNTFHDSSFDSINEFNGQLTVPISVGPEYPVGPSLKLQIMLVYNSKVWDYVAKAGLNHAVGELRGQSQFGLGWKMHFVGFPRLRGHVC